MSTLRERLALAMEGPPRVSQAALARACRIKPPSVSDWLSGKTKSIEGANLMAAARLLRVSPDWLATGKGSKTVESQHMGYEVETILDAQKLLREYAKIRDESPAIAEDPRKLRIACKIIVEESRHEKLTDVVDLMQRLSAAFRADRENEDGNKRREVEGTGAADGSHRRSRARKA